MTPSNLALDCSRDNSPAAGIRSRAHPNCFLCGSVGRLLYEGLPDRLFSAPGIWNLKRCSDSACGLIWLDPMPLVEDIGGAYENYFTHASPAVAAPPRLPRRIAECARSAYRAWRFNYGEGAGKPLRWLLAMPILLSRIECDTLDLPLRYLAVPDKGRMLDVGCGNGAVVKLACDLGWDATGVDFDPQAIAAVRRQGLAVECGRLADQAYPDNSFDLVLMSHVIEHVHDPLDTLAEINRILRTGGRLAMTTPNADSWGHSHFGSSCVHLDPPRHLHIFNAANLAEMARRAGFARSMISSTLSTTPFVFAQSRLIRRTGSGAMLKPPARWETIHARACTFAEMLMRLWNPLIADELLLEACK